MLLILPAPGVRGAPVLPLPRWTARAPIVITSNSGFTAANGVVSGSGTPADPYVISGWTITSASGNGITIMGTSASFVIRDVLVINGSAYNAGISFTNLSNGWVENVTIEYGWTYGITMTAVSGVTVAASWFRSLGSDANVYASSGVMFELNQFLGSPSGPGISANATIASRFSNNTISGAFIGIYVGANSDVDVVGNQIVQSGLGIEMDFSRGNVLWNNVTNNGNGLGTKGASNLVISANRFGWNSGIGIVLTASTGVQAYHNDLISNGVEATDDMGPQNAWDNGYPSGGNYWSNYTGVDRCSGPLQTNCTGGDGIGDTPLVIDANSTDRYPLITPLPIVQPSPPANYTLYGDASLGWGLSASNISNPGPTLYAVLGSPLTLRLISHDGNAHRWFLDLNGNGIPDAAEPLSPLFNGTTPINYTFAPIQTGTFAYRCAIHPATMVGTMVIQSTVPHTHLTLTGRTGANGWYLSPVNVTLSATGPGPGPWSTYYRINGSSWTPYAGPFTIAAEGVNALDYYSNDSSGHVEPVQSAAVKVDSTGPVVHFGLTGSLSASGWYNSSVTWSFTGVSSVAQPVDLSCTVDAVVSDPCASSGQFLSDGIHSFAYTATDAAGYSVTASFPVLIDTQPPITSLALLGTLGAGGWYKTNVSAAVVATDSESGVASTRVRIDNGSWTEVTTFTLSDGVHYVEYRSTDHAGNAGAIQAKVVRVDATGPRFTTLSAPSGIVTSSQVTLSWLSVDPLSGITEYNISVDFGPAISQGTSTSKTLSLADGDHTIVVIAWSGSGAFAREEIHFRVDTNPLSPTGPYGVAIPVAGIVIGLVAIAVLVWEVVLRKRPRKPAADEATGAAREERTQE